MGNSVYHSLLRILSLLVAGLLVFDSGFLIPGSALLSNQAQSHLATVVGVSVGVPANEVNVLTTRITELESELAERERVIAVSLESTSGEAVPVSRSTIVLSLILFILLTLIVLNYYLDYRRGRFDRTTYFDPIASR